MGRGQTFAIETPKSENLNILKTIKECCLFTSENGALGLTLGKVEASCLLQMIISKSRGLKMANPMAMEDSLNQKGNIIKVHSKTVNIMELDNDCIQMVTLTLEVSKKGFDMAEGFTRTLLGLRWMDNGIRDWQMDQVR